MSAAPKKQPPLTDAWIQESIFDGWASQTQIFKARVFLLGERARDEAEQRKVLARDVKQ